MGRIRAETSPGRAAEKLARYLAKNAPARTGSAIAPRGILPDTCAWIDYFRNPVSPLARAVDSMPGETPIHTCGQVMCELLQGVRSDQDRTSVLDALGSLEYLEMEARVWLRAGDIAAALRRAGKRIPHSDLLIGALALEHGLTVLTADRHFLEIPGLDVTGIEAVA